MWSVGKMSLSIINIRDKVTYLPSLAIIIDAFGKLRFSTHIQTNYKTGITNLSCNCKSILKLNKKSNISLCVILLRNRVPSLPLFSSSKICDYSQKKLDFFQIL